MNKYIIILSLLLILLSELVIAQKYITILDGTQDIFSIEKSIQYYEDKSRVIDIKQIQSPIFQQKFIPYPKQILNFGNTSSAVWLKVTLAIKTNKKYYLQIDNPTLDSVYFYFLDEKNTFQYKLTGKSFPISTEDIPSTHYLVQLSQPNTQAVQTFYLRVTATNFMHLPMKIIAQEYLILSLLKRYTFELIYFGVIILAIFYNLFVYFFTKQIAYFYYVSYTFIMGFNIFNTRGYLTFLFPEYRDFIQQFGYIPSFLYLVFIILFTLNFLKVKKYSLFFYYLLYSFLVIFCLHILLIAIGYKGFIFRSGLVFASVSLLVCVGISIVIYFKNYKTAFFYILSWGIYTVLSIYSLLCYANIFTFYHFTRYISPTAVALETILSSLALGYSMNALKKENFNILKRQKATLENEVRIRTEEVEEQKQEVQTQNEELTQQREELTIINESLGVQNSMIELQNKELYRNNKEIVALKNNLEGIVIQRTNELKQALDDLTKQNQDISQFSFIISHNIRAPIARILGLVNIFNENDYNDSFNKEIITHLKSTTIDLDTVIKDLTQIISVRNDLNKTKEEVDILEIIEATKNLLQNEIKNTNTVINIDISAKNKFFSIRSYIKSIIFNLIANAIKYKSNKRSPVIAIRTEVANGFVCLFVQDNGLGIDLTDVDMYKIFGLYQRMHDHVEGKGLGLFLVKTQIESLGGKVEIESKLDVGTTLKVYFPL
ncbi:MAG: hypothetical protein EAZ08_12020 [Cytophagales bacterium]|nr:MAG: hypothetical protein EAZ08_12020 [Cytophagales bacterium]